MIMRTLLFFGSLALSPLLGHSQTPPQFNDLIAVTDPEMDDKARHLLLGGILGGNNKAEKQKVSLGRICGNHNPCKDGLDCVRTSGITYRICLPMTCVQEVANKYNTPAKEGDMPPFQEYHYNVLAGAGLSPTMFEDHMENDILNETTVRLASSGPFTPDIAYYVLKEYVKWNLRNSLWAEQAKDPLDIKTLNQKIRTCFSQFDNDPENELVEINEGTRNLQLDNVTFSAFQTIPGFFIEFSAVAQILYGLGVFEFVDGVQAIFHDVCFGAGPTAGGGTGFLLQLMWSPILTAEELFSELGVEEPDPLQQVILPIPFPGLMVDLDAGLGPYFGMAYNTIAFNCHRLWFKFGLGAGGGLAISVCVVNLCLSELPTDQGP